MTSRILRRKDLLYPELSYKIVGILFKVWNEIGYSHKEKYIQKAIANFLANNNIPFQKEMKVNLEIEGRGIGRYFLDFLIDDQIVLEVKKCNYFSQKDIEQLYAYLKATGLKLGIIAHFTNKGIRFKRILNLR